MWLTGRLAPDHKTIADFRKDNGRAIRQACARFVVLCRTMGLLKQASVAIDGSKFRRSTTATRTLPAPRWSGAWRRSRGGVARYLQQLDTADRQEPYEALHAKTTRLKEKIAKLKRGNAKRLHALEARMLAARTSRYR